MLTLISKNMVMKWFDHHRGMANAILGISISFGFSLAPRVLNGMMETDGWDGAWRQIGLLTATIGALLFWLISRDNPFECGMKPDSKKEITVNKKRPPSHPAHDFTLKQARRTLPFWVIGLTLAMHSLYVTAFTFHIVSIFASAGNDPDTGYRDFLSRFHPVSNFQLHRQLAQRLYSHTLYPYCPAGQPGGMHVFYGSPLSGVNYIMVIIGYGIMGDCSILQTVSYGPVITGLHIWGLLRDRLWDFL